MGRVTGKCHCRQSRLGGRNPTVRDERGACGLRLVGFQLGEAYGSERNVSYGGTRNPLHNRKGAGRKLST